MLGLPSVLSPMGEDLSFEDEEQLEEFLKEERFKHERFLYAQTVASKSVKEVELEERDPILDQLSQLSRP